jgi:cytochrome c553
MRRRFGACRVPVPPAHDATTRSMTHTCTAPRFAVRRLAALVVAALVAGPAFAQGTAPAGNAEAGRSKASMCIGCHEIPGYKASFPHVHEVPMILGQSARYIESALQAYRKGDRNHPTMRAVAGSLSDQDIADLAALYGTR